MAFTEEQEGQILQAIGQFGEFMKNFQTQQQTQTQGKPAEQEQKQAGGLLDTAKEKMSEKEKEDALQKKTEAALRFNMKISEFAEKYKDVLPAATGAILKEAEGKTFGSEAEKADEVRKTLIEAYLEEQKNVDEMPPSLRAKAEVFKGLTEDAKRRRSAEFIEILEMSAELAYERRRAAAVAKANAVGVNTEGNAFKARFYALGDKWKRKG